MTHAEIRAKFRNFFESKGHAWVDSSSLLPDDPSVLFTTAGMQQFKPYYTGAADAKRDFGSLNTASIQKCIRTSDIDEVGDESHLTFFEMLGNFSFGGYFKEEAIRWGHEFITKGMGLTIDYVSVFAGEGDVPADDESERIWKSIDPSIRIVRAGRADGNFWGPTGDEGPCGPTTEIYVDGIEIWNIVFNQYYQHPDKRLELLKTPGIDTGMGFERLALVSQFPGQVGSRTVFDTDLFLPLFDPLPESLSVRERRIAADHLRAAVFLMDAGVRPSNKDQGYVLRRLLRRVLTMEHRLSLSPQIFEDVLLAVIADYGSIYPSLRQNGDDIINAYFGESAKFKESLSKGLREMERHPVAYDAAGTFRIYESFGVPFEVVRDLGKTTATRQEFEAEAERHREKSRAGSEKKFGGHGLLLDTGELKAANEEELKVVTRLHTATHLLHAALRKVLGDEVHQAGSDISVERTRFDFTFARKLTPEEIRKVQEMVNDIIRRDLPVSKITLAREDAEKTGALHFFKIKYPEQVDVYTVGDPAGEWFSKEFCGGPHVTHTGEIGPVRIAKEEAVSAGVRRIRAVLD